MVDFFFFTKEHMGIYGRNGKKYSSFFKLLKVLLLFLH